MSKELKLKPSTDTEVINSYEVIVGDNGHTVGKAIRDVDGYFYFYYDGLGGLWASYTLRTVADLLDYLNKEWDETVANANV